MAIAYAQRRGLAPSLQDPRLFPGGVIDRPVLTTSARNGDLDTTYFEQPEVLRAKRAAWRGFGCVEDNATSANISLGELVFGFFWHYGKRMDIRQACVTSGMAPPPPRGAAVKGADCSGYGRLLSKRRRWGLKCKPWRLSIEDPFEPWHDLGQPVSREGQVRIQKELARAADLLASGGSIAELIKPVAKVVHSRAGARGTPRRGRGGGGRGKGAAATPPGSKSKKKKGNKTTPRGTPAERMKRQQEHAARRDAALNKSGGGGGGGAAPSRAEARRKRRQWRKQEAAKATANGIARAAQKKRMTKQCVTVES